LVSWLTNKQDQELIYGMVRILGPRISQLNQEDMVV
jgi:hypothetical protein